MAATAMTEEIDLLLVNGIVLTLNDADDIFQSGAVAVAGDEISWVGPMEQLPPGLQVKERLDLQGNLLMPGLINGHTHAAMTLFRGLADDLPLLQWLNEHIFPAERHLDGDAVFHGTMLACAEMILGGVTTFCDMYLFEEQVALAAKRAGMRALVGEVLYDFPSPSYGPLERGLALTRELIQGWRGDHLVSFAVEPHAVYTCSPELLTACGDIAAQYQVPLIVHLSESADEVRQVQERYGRTPVEHLHSLGLLQPFVVGCHCVALSEAEMDLLAGGGVRVVHMPESNMKLASGVAPVPDLLARSIPVALGTDGCASNNDLDMWGEMDTAAKLHKVQRRDPTVMDAATVVRMATRGGAAALGLQDRIGTLEPGKKADLIAVDLQAPHLVPLYNIYSHLVYSAAAADVVLTVINGKVLMRDRQLVEIDLDEVLAKAREIARRIKP